MYRLTETELREIISSWNEDMGDIIESIRQRKSNQYKLGVADGIEMAVQSLIETIENAEKPENSP